MARKYQREASPSAASSSTQPNASAALSGTTTIDLGGLDPEMLVSMPLTEVELDALVVMKIIKHARDSYPITATGQLMGIDVKGSLEVTHSFPFFISKTSGADEGGPAGSSSYHSTTSGAAEDDMDGPEYQLQMLRCLRKLNYDANTVGWYQSTYLGSFWNQTFIETQYNYQKVFGQSVVLVYDPTRTSQGTLSLRALRLSDTFMAVFKEKKFTLETIHKLTPSSVLESLPIKVKNSHLLNAFLHQLDENSYLSCPALDFINQPCATFAPPATTSLPSISLTQLSPNFDNMELGLENYLEKHLEYLGDTIEEHGQEQWRWHGWQRNLQKEQQKLNAIVARKRQENASRVAAGMEPLYSDDELLAAATSPALLKLMAGEPSRLETLIITNQIDTYCKQVNQFAGPGLAKMYMTKALQPVSSSGVDRGDAPEN